MYINSSYLPMSYHLDLKLKLPNFQKVLTCLQCMAVKWCQISDSYDITGLCVMSLCYPVNGWLDFLSEEYWRF